MERNIYIVFFGDNAAGYFTSEKLARKFAPTLPVMDGYGITIWKAHVNPVDVNDITKRTTLCLEVL